MQSKTVAEKLLVHIRSRKQNIHSNGDDKNKLCKLLMKNTVETTLDFLPKRPRPMQNFAAEN